jgi:DNA (cytosine-5)-methyltransferase 1
MRTAVGVYIYAGGFSKGVMRAGFVVPAHFEEGPFGAKTSELNLGVETHQEPLAWPMSEWRDRVDFVHSNPPCAPWSNAGKVVDGKRGAAFAGDIRLSCVERSFDAAMEMRPRVWAWESVSRTPVLASAYIEDLAKRAGKRGYECTVLSLDAVDVGAPQYRRRAFVLMHDVELELVLPKQDRVRTVRDAWKSERPETTPRPNVSASTAKWLHRVPQGGKLNKCYNDIFNAHDKNNVVGRPGFLQRRLAWDKPAFTITGGAHHYHPTEPRYVSVHESAVLCGFPADYTFLGGTSAQYAQVGKGVTVQAAEWLGKAVKRGIERGRAVERPGRVNHVDLLRRQTSSI